MRDRPYSPLVGFNAMPYAMATANAERDHGPERRNGAFRR